jgi:hypothetical protein
MSANNEDMWRHGEVNAGSCALSRGCFCFYRLLMASEIKYAAGGDSWSNERVGKLFERGA